MKIYIIATPCSGKTTFIKNNNYKYKFLNLYDHDDYGSCISDKLLKFDDNSCMFGGPHTPISKEIIYIAVLIPIDQLQRNLKQRQKTSPANGWNSMDKLLNDKNTGRIVLEQTIKKHNIPVFSSFIEAMTFLCNSTSIDL